MTTGQPNESPRVSSQRKHTATPPTGPRASGDGSTSGPSPSEATAPANGNDRWIYIRNKVAEALKTIRANPKYDWTKEPGEAQSTAAENLVISMGLYGEEKQGEAEVKAAYSTYVQTYHKEAL